MNTKPFDRKRRKRPTHQVLRWILRLLMGFGIWNIYFEAGPWTAIVVGFLFVVSEINDLISDAQQKFNTAVIKRFD